MLRLAATLFLLVPIIAFAGKNTPHDPKTFAEYKDSTYFEVAEDFKYSERRGIGYRWEQGLKAGRYEGKFQDNSGYFYFGPASAVCQENPSCKGFDKEGGIWVSRTDPTDVRLFIVENLSPETVSTAGRDFGPIIGALVRKDNGKIFIFPKNKDFVSRISISRAQAANDH